MWTYLLVFALVTFLLCFLDPSRSLNKPPLNGIYSRPGKWFRLKFLIFYALLKLRKVGTSHHATNYSRYSCCMLWNIKKEEKNKFKICTRSIAKNGEKRGKKIATATYYFIFILAPDMQSSIRHTF